MGMRRHLRLARRGGAAALLLAVFLLPADSGRASGPAPLLADAPHDANVRINAPQLPAPHGLLGRAGEAVAADPSGEQLVAAWETIRGFCGPPMGRECTPPAAPGTTGYGTSTDGGRTWLDGGAPPVVDHTITGGHPWLDRGGADRRTFFLVSRGWDAQKVAQKGLTFYRGRFDRGVFTWQDGRLLAPPRTGDVWRGSTVVAAKDGSGLLLMTLTNLRALCGPVGGGLGQIEVLRSGDGGSTWDPPVVVSPGDSVETADRADPRCADSGTVQVAASTVLDPRGAAYLVWQSGPHLTDYSRQTGTSTSDHAVRLRFARSLDAGRSWSAPRDLVQIHSLRDDPPVGYDADTVNDIPRIALAEGGRHRGRIYVTYASAVAPAVPEEPTEQCLVSTQVFLISSDDQGRTWSAPLPLGPPLPPAGVKRFWPSVAVAPGGEVNVVYLQSQESLPGRDAVEAFGGECRPFLLSGLFRTGRASSLVDLYQVVSADGGATFGPPRRVTTATSNWCTAFYDMGNKLFANFGDYLGVFASRDRLFAVWTDARSGVPDAYFAALSSAAPAGPSRGRP